MSKTIGFIGYKGHALRLMDIVQKIEGFSVSAIYHPHKSSHDLTRFEQIPPTIKITNQFDELFTCDAIVVASPNHTHFSFLKTLSASYRGYVFCEKPPVSSLEELEMLRQFPDDFKKRLYFNFNYRTSWLRDQLDHVHGQFNLGKPVQISVMVGYGFAFKDSYRSSWRSGKEFPAFGVLETMGIHYLDLVGQLYAEPQDGVCFAQKHAPYGDAKDTCDFSCRLANGSVLHICCSYAIPYINRMEVQYTDGRLSYDDGRFIVSGPRDTFSDKGAFISPPVIYQATKSGMDVYMESLQRSCRYFTQTVSATKTFSIESFNQSLVTNKVCLSAKSL